jgi:hypothetical protein
MLNPFFRTQVDSRDLNLAAKQLFGHHIYNAGNTFPLFAIGPYWITIRRASLSEGLETFRSLGKWAITSLGANCSQRASLQRKLGAFHHIHFSNVYKRDGLIVNSRSQRGGKTAKSWCPNLLNLQLSSAISV